eukprot:235343-Alexandrium_andersonii.AAC.1
MRCRRAIWSGACKLAMNALSVRPCSAWPRSLWPPYAHRSTGAANRTPRARTGCTSGATHLS